MEEEYNIRADGFYKSDKENELNEHDKVAKLFYKIYYRGFRACLVFIVLPLLIIIINLLIKYNN